MAPPPAYGHEVVAPLPPPEHGHDGGTAAWSAVVAFAKEAR